MNIDDYNFLVNKSRQREGSKEGFKDL